MVSSVEFGEILLYIKEVPANTNNSCCNRIQELQKYCRPLASSPLPIDVDLRLHSSNLSWSIGSQLQKPLPEDVHKATEELQEKCRQQQLSSYMSTRALYGLASKLVLLISGVKNDRKSYTNQQSLQTDTVQHMHGASQTYGNKWF